MVLLGCNQKPKDTIKIGRILPLTGPAASYGQSEKKGTLLALEEINQSNFLGKYKLEILFEDDECNVRNGVNVMKKFVEINKFPIVVGATCSGVTMALAPLANENRVVLLSPLSSLSDITYAGPYVFRIMPSDAFQSKKIAEWIIEEGYKRIAMLSITNAWGVGVSEEFLKEYTKLGGEIIIHEHCKEGDTDFRTQLLKIRNSRPEALFIPTMPKEGGLILRQLRELNIQLPVFGADAWSVSELTETAGSAANGVRYVFPKQYDGKEFEIFSEKFFQKFNERPDVNAAGAYDAINIVSFVLKNILEKNLEVTGANIKNELEKIENFKGATGNTTFDENGDPIGKEFQKMIIIDNQRINYSDFLN